HHRRRDRARRARGDGRADHPRGGGRRPRRVPDRGEGGAADRARRPGGGGRRPGPGGRAHLPGQRRAHAPGGPGRRRAGAALEGAQGGRRRGRPRHPQLRAPGRRGAAIQAADRHGTDPGHRRPVRRRGGQRVPCRRREPPPDDLLRRARAGRVRARPGGERGDPARVHRAGRHRDRRARRGAGQGREAGAAVRPRGPRGDARGPPGVRPARPHEPGEGAPIRRAPVRAGPGGGKAGPGGDVGVTETALAGALEGAVGSRGALLAGDAAAAFAVDGVAPRFVAVPATVEAAGRVLAVAAEAGLAVTPAGGGARLGWGNRPARLDLVLSLARLDRVLAHEPADLTLSVEAGARLDGLNRALAPFGQFLPLDPAREAASTIGGLIATGAAGPYRARYGTMRDLLLGVTVARADGILVKAGGRVVKNVTGYDVPKLHVGAHGTLGVVLEAHLRLHPRPAEERSWIFGFASPEAALEAAVAVRDTPVVLSRCQLLEAGALRALGEPAPPAAALGATVAEACVRAGSAPIEIPDAAAWWRALAEVTWPPATAEAATLALRIGVRPADLVKALRIVEAAVPPGGALVATAELANGVLHATMRADGPEA